MVPSDTMLGGVIRYKATPFLVVGIETLVVVFVAVVRRNMALYYMSANFMLYSGHQVVVIFATLHL